MTFSNACISFHENVWISLKISLKCISKVPNGNEPALIQVMAWCWTGTSHYLNQWCPSLLMHIYASLGLSELTHWGQVTHICIDNLAIICPDNGLSPGQHQAIIWTNAGILLIGPWGTNFSEISIGIQTFSFKKMHLNMSSAKWRPFCLGLNVLKMLASYHFQAAVWKFAI